MKTRDTLKEQGTSAGPGHARSISRGAAIGTIFVVLLIIGASALVFAQLSRYHKDQAALPPGGKWVQVLNGYTLAPPVAGESTPSTLYACAAHAQNTVTTTGSTTTRTCKKHITWGGDRDYFRSAAYYWCERAGIRAIEPVSQGPGRAPTWRQVGRGAQWVYPCAAGGWREHTLNPLCLRCPRSEYCDYDG